MQEELRDLRGAVEGVTGQVSGVPPRLKQLNPQPSLSKIPRPVQNEDFKHTNYGAAFLREKITSFNVSTSGEKYKEFPENWKERQLNFDAKEFIGSFLSAN